MRSSLVDGTKRVLLDLLKTQGVLSVQELASEAKLAKTTVKQHLLALERRGLLERDFRKKVRGRPELSYRLSPSAQHIYPTHEPELLRSLLAFLIDRGEEHLLETFFKQFWAERREKFADVLVAIGGKRPTLEKRAEALREVLEAEGFMPRIVRGPGSSITVEECNCPFSETIKSTRIPCRLESEFIAWALAADVERQSYLPSGGATCTYVRERPGNNRSRSRNV